MAIFKITLLFLGSIIGAGFATGAEIVTFFGHLHLPTWFIAIIIGLTMFSIITLEIFLHYPQSNQSCTQTIDKTILKPRKLFQNQTKLTIFLDVVFVMIYQILFTAMTAGIIQITNIFLCSTLLFTSTGIVLFGFQRLSQLNTYIVLIIIILIVSTALPHLNSTNHITYHHTDIISALFWAFLYAGLNCFMFPEIIKTAALTHKRRSLIWAGIITAILVTVLVGLILSTVQNTNTESAAMPLFAAAPHRATTIIILLAIFTSQYSALFVITQRVQELLPRTRKKPLFVAVSSCLVALIGSFCGFNHIIQFGYPLIGAFTCFYLLFSFSAKFLQHLQHHPS